MTQKIRIADLPKFPNGTTIPAIEGMITRIDRYVSGPAKNNLPAWSLQEFVIQDGADSFPAQFKDRDECPKDMGGKRTAILCHNGKNGITGAKIKEVTDYKTKQKKLVLYITPSASVTALGTANGGESHHVAPESHHEEPARSEHPHQRQTHQEAPRAASPAPANGTEMKWSKVCSNVDIIVDLLALITARVSTKMVEQVKSRGGYMMNSEHIQAASMSVFIEYNRKFGLNGLPTKPLPEPKKAAPVQPDPIDDPSPEPSDNDGHNV